MAVELKIPTVGESITEVQIGEWLKSEGDRVELNEPLVIIETDKATVEMESPVAGKVLEVAGEVGDVIAIGSPLVVIEWRLAPGWPVHYVNDNIRQWGYDQLFASGKLPPIIPRVLSYRRVDFTYLANAAAYATEVSRL